MRFGEMLYLDEFRYSGVYDITDYESREVGVQIRIRNRQKPTKRPKDLADKSGTLNGVREFCMRTQFAYTISGFSAIQRV